MDTNEMEPVPGREAAQYHATYDASFQDSLRDGGRAEIDFNLYLVHPSGKVEIVY